VQLDKIKGKELEQLFEAVLSLKTMDDCYLFFDDLCTVNEMKSMAQRLEVARMLRDKQTYSQIEEETGASTATISRVKRCLNYGNGGYMAALERLDQRKKV
jgi:TrpR-related protein YerC/YecD